MLYGRFYKSLSFRAPGHGYTVVAIHCGRPYRMLQVGRTPPILNFEAAIKKNVKLLTKTSLAPQIPLVAPLGAPDPQFENHCFRPPLF